MLLMCQDQERRGRASRVSNLLTFLRQNHSQPAAKKTNEIHCINKLDIFEMFTKSPSLYYDISATGK
jgi:hypothetical protein